MSNPYDGLSTRLIEEVLKYDDPDPKERKAMEEYLTKSNQILKTGKVVTKQVKKVKPASKTFRKVRPASTPMNIDISLPPELTKMLKEGQ
jgi:hypothetical protein